LNSHIVSKTKKWIWKTKIEKTFGKNNPSVFLGRFWPISFFPWHIPHAHQSPEVARPISSCYRLPQSDKLLPIAAPAVDPSEGILAADALLGRG
jgi:hypothetical protein